MAVYETQHDNVIDIFEAWFTSVRITNPHSVRINSKCSDVAWINQASVTELFFENTERLRAVNYFLKMAPLHMFDWFIATPLKWELII